MLLMGKLAFESSSRAVLPPAPQSAVSLASAMRRTTGPFPDVKEEKIGWKEEKRGSKGERGE
jgi:hypothetical protein